jgi:hypothetical protein
MMPVTREHLERTDAELATQSRAEAALRLRLGQALEVLGRGACFELGFSSLTAYALERCERGTRWVEEARCLARRLEALPVLRHAVAFGVVSWRKAVLVARVATPNDEAQWAAAAQHLTVRQLLARLSAETSQPSDTDSRHADDSEEVCTLTCTVDREEAWLFEATRALLEQLGTSSTNEQLEALLAEAQGTLLHALPRGTLTLEDACAANNCQARWREQLARWRTEAEIRCEDQMGRASGTRPRAAPRDAAEHRSGCEAMIAAASGYGTLESLTALELDAIVRNLARALAEHELALSRLILEFHRADGWRRLGYATETQYARERLGISRSALLGRRALAMKLESLPRVAEALGQSHIGVEAALQLVRIATPKTELAWIARAEKRTIKHLREEVSAALTAVRVSGDPECPPPAEAEIDAFQDLERAASSGSIFQSASESPLADCEAGAAQGEASNAWHVTLASLAEWLARGVQMCAGHATGASNGVRHVGRVELRLRVSRETYSWWRGLEKQARRWLPTGMSWLRFCCLSLWKAWRHLLNPNIAYGHIYIRDRHRCTSPVCTRRDVTPHHIQFRSAGGSDVDDNVAAVCTWCHLLGIHGGRIRAVGSADRIHWELGARRETCLVVDGRERQAA